MKTEYCVLAVLALTLGIASPALADTTVYPGTICTDGGRGIIEIPFTRGGVRVTSAAGGALFCPLPSPDGMVIQNVWVRIRRGNFFGEIMLTVSALDAFGAHRDGGQGRFVADHRNQSVSYRIPLPAEGLSTVFGGYFMMDLVLNHNDEVVSIRVDTL